MGDIPWGESTEFRDTSETLTDTGVSKSQKLMEKAKVVLSDSDNWVPSTIAVDKHGQPVHWNSPSAVRWSTWGIVKKISEQSHEAETIQSMWDMDFYAYVSHSKLADAAESMGYKAVRSLEVEGGHEKVLEMFDIAIRMTK